MRIAILGNAGSGKSTLARRLAAQARVPVLDLDTIHWAPNQIAVARPTADAIADLHGFCALPGWVIEGCYGDLVEAALRHRPQLLFLNPGEATCLRHCRERPWEPHKYPSREAQDARLDGLLAWVSDYYRRDGSLSLAGHRALFEAYDGPKREIVDPA
jgi:adenylate kinase family enzyme